MCVYMNIEILVCILIKQTRVFLPFVLNINKTGPSFINQSFFPSFMNDSAYEKPS